MQIDTAENHETLPCGRPLGLAFTNENSLIVIHSYEGVYEVKLDSGNKKLLISRDEVIGETVRKFQLEFFSSHQMHFRIHDHVNYSTQSLSLRTAIFSLHIHRLKLKSIKLFTQWQSILQEG